MDTFVTVEIVKWNKFNARADIKSPTWLRLDHSFFEDPQLFDLSSQELAGFIYILCQASKKSSSIVHVNLNHCQVVGRIKKAVFFSTIKKLTSVGILTVPGTDTAVHDRAHTDAAVKDYAASTLHTNTTNTTNITNKQTDNIRERSLVGDQSSLPPMEGVFSEFTNEKIKPLIAKIPPDLPRSWVDTYQDEQWVAHELKLGYNWLLANLHKTPKRDLARFFNGWLSRNWEKHRKTLPSSQQKTAAQEWAEEEMQKQMASF